MSFSHRINVPDHSMRLDCGSQGEVEELGFALDGVVGDAGFDHSFGLLVELGRDGPMLQCAHALAVADAFGDRRAVLLGRIALHAADERGRIAALYIAMIARHQGVCIQAFGHRAEAESWLGHLG
jgi:hypothetical protein